MKKLTRHARRLAVAAQVFSTGVLAGGASAGLALPTPEQVAWHDCEIGMFIHFGPATWQDSEYDTLATPLEQINPARLDTDQWVAAAEAMGARYIVFVAKHTGGFCWWQTDTTDYGVRNTPWRGGKGDVMADLSRSCRARGIKLGVYLSPQDSKMGAGTGGRCGSPEAQARYDNLFRRQLTELLSRYGDMFEVWFDGSTITDVGDILKRHCPRAMVFQGPYATIRWVGNEEGVAPYPCWNALPMARAKSGVSTGADGSPDGDAWLPNECDARIRATWFWNSTGAATLKSVEQLMAMYEKSVGRGGVLLLNMTPDTTGRFPESDMLRAAAFGAEIRRRFGKSVAETAGQGSTVELDLGGVKRIDHVVTMEDIAGGERVREYRVEGLAGEAWNELCRGTSIGHKKIDRISPVEVSRLRLQVVRSAGEPLIRKLAAYWAGAAPAAAGGNAGEGERRTVWEWSPATLGEAWKPIDIDLTGACRDACVYQLEFKSAEGNLPEVRSLAYRFDGTALPEFVRQSEAEPGQYYLIVTGLGKPLGLRAEVRRGGTDKASGVLTVRKLSLP